MAGTGRGKGTGEGKHARASAGANVSRALPVALARTRAPQNPPDPDPRIVSLDSEPEPFPPAILRSMLPRLLLASLTCAITPAQTHEFPDRHTPPTGIVVDEDGAPLAEAHVSLVASTNAELPFSAAIAQVLSRTPLPEARTHDDGTFVLPLTRQQRSIHLPENTRFRHDITQFWLIVEKDGYLPWREPIERGLRMYMGSRVVLRKKRADDPYARLPWPPADPKIGYPWLSLDDEPRGPEASRHGAPTKGTPSETRCVTSIQILDAEGMDVPRARLLFGNSCYCTVDDVLPVRTDKIGQAKVETPRGQHRLIVIADGFMPHVETWKTRDARARVSIKLQPADIVDVRAIDDDKVPVPFVDVDIVSFHHNRDDRPSLSISSDSLGRIRVCVPEREDYFGYNDSQQPHRSPFVNKAIVRVQKYRPVTVVLHADDLPNRGTLMFDDGTQIMQSFSKSDRSSEWIATRVFARGMERAWIGGRGKPPIVIRKKELPAPSREPILDLAALDRRVRKRASLAIQIDDDKPVLGFSIVPDWQSDWRDRFELMRFSQRGENRQWELKTRDDFAYDAVVSAKGCALEALAIKAARPGEPLPTIAVKLSRNQ